MVRETKETRLRKACKRVAYMMRKIAEEVEMEDTLEVLSENLDEMCCEADLLAEETAAYEGDDTIEAPWYVDVLSEFAEMLRREEG